MLPFPQLTKYGNIVVRNDDDKNPNSLSGTVSTLGTNSNFGAYGTRMTSCKERLFAITQSSQVFQINPENDSFTQITTRPVSVRNIGFTTNGQYLYCAGGYSSTNRFDRYNLTTGTWDTLANLPSANYDHSICVDYDKNDFIYYQKNNTFYKYDMINNVWITTGLANLPFSTTNSAEGGWIYSSGYIYYLYGNNFAKYSIESNTWSTLASYPGSGSRQKISRMGDNIYARSSANGLYVYKLSSNSWTLLNSSLPVGHAEGGIVCSYNHAYAISTSTLYKIV